ncbi:MAG: nicotinate-nucleotide--dimethylbenzimidazole phosphoribosyltransferase [Pseudomonadota bacterium]
MNNHDVPLIAKLRNVLDTKTKPVGSLGQIETIAETIALTQETLQPRADTCALTIFAGDHGMAAFGLSAYPQVVTRQMVLNFLAGGAAANVFAQTLGVDVQIVDAGVLGDPIDHPNIVNQRIGSGTQNAMEHPAMTPSQVDAAFQAGQEIGENITADVACFGEMGIGNTSSASLLSAKLLGAPVADFIGPGTGLDAAGLARKRRLLEAASARTEPKLNAKIALSEYGGFEIAMMSGAMIGAASNKRIVIVDGFIAGAAALCARELSPGSETAFIYGHRSAEPGHARVLDALHARPLLDLNMRLGEGTGALLAWPLVKAAAAMLRDMASFESANVSGPA